ncbi:hypothetical protein FisN_5Lh304 [Fistulifera solaris]|uniref:Auxin efflux carrier family n=1 Tax=Fistulifera solaris TaxID=1519565 RepID=A0A1Z5KGN2_FISSO|nr:hypothetical protein FisN_5Lh304 [Fistulifera solaris]|eukprot:GAX25221.1 hypothetical protein FisN_5Lh304 [Fistulifera solaris]
MVYKYISVVNVGIQIVGTVVLGSLSSWIGVFDNTFVVDATKFVFWVALPALVINGIGVGIDFYSDAFVWDFIKVFLLIRVASLLLSFFLVIAVFRERKGLGDVAVQFLNFSWISTIVHGIPILTAILPDPAMAVFFGLMAGISSFLFQLPLQLFFLEASVLERQLLFAPEVTDEEALTAEKESTPPHEINKVDEETHLEEEHSEIKMESDAKLETPKSRLALWLELISRRDILTQVTGRVIRNPVLWGICIGFIISLSTFGKTYLRPLNDQKEPNTNYVEGLEWFVALLNWLGDMVSPLSLFSMGVWMHQQGKDLISISWLELAGSMLVKLVLIPLLMVGLVDVYDLPNTYARSAVLVAALPISLAAFSLGKQFDIGEASLAANVTMGTILMLPALLAWIEVLDHFELYMI